MKKIVVIALSFISFRSFAAEQATPIEECISLQSYLNYLKVGDYLNPKPSEKKFSEEKNKELKEIKKDYQIKIEAFQNLINQKKCASYFTDSQKALNEEIKRVQDSKK